MAKKSTWEKREKKVKKEEFLVLGGSTSKKRYPSKPAATKGKPKSDNDTANDEKPSRTRSSSSKHTSSERPSSAPTKGRSRSEGPYSKDGKGPRTRSTEKPSGADRRSRETTKPDRAERAPRGEVTEGRDIAPRNERAYGEGASNATSRSRGTSDRTYNKSSTSRTPRTRDDRPAGRDERTPRTRGESSDRSYGSDKPSYSRGGSDRPNRTSSDRSYGSDKPSYSKGGSDRPSRTSSDNPRSKRPSDRSYGDGGDRPSRADDRPFRSTGDGPRSGKGPGKSFGDSKFRKDDGERKFNPSDFITRDGDEGSSDKFKSRGYADKQFRQGDKKKSYGKFTDDKPFKGFEKKEPTPSDGLTRLNKYLAMAGIASRREADTYIEQGLVSINGKVVTELGTKVKPGDLVEYAGEKVRSESLRYILLNKPKDVITTLSDERGRSTVIGLIKNACKERVFPVGRLDRNTTGLILLTNDGDLAEKLAHPSNEVRKVYHVITDKNVSIADLKKLETGIQLEDGIAKADAALFAGDGSVRTEIGLEIHSGRNRIVRRMFEALGYDVVRLDRAAFAGLSKKGLPRGRWRFLTEKEVGYLKML